MQTKKSYFGCRSENPPYSLKIFHIFFKYQKNQFQSSNNTIVLILFSVAV